jgi:hypothetical protein
VRRLAEFLAGDLPLHRGDANLDNAVLIGDQRQAALDTIAAVRERWQWLLDHLDLPLAEAETHFRNARCRPPAPANKASDSRTSSTACRITRCACRGRPNSSRNSRHLRRQRLPAGA